MFYIELLYISNYRVLSFEISTILFVDNGRQAYGPPDGNKKRLQRQKYRKRIVDLSRSFI